VKPAHDARAMAASSGELHGNGTAMDRANTSPYTPLRVATIGYNVSIEKPVVVRHDVSSRSIWSIA
jgi:hypothetical protein